jgi:hypothetical protein
MEEAVIEVRRGTAQLVNRRARPGSGVLGGVVRFSGLSMDRRRSAGRQKLPPRVRTHVAAP